jgi:hypothetical protein
MNVTLKRLQIHNRLSEETLCFTADILVDGKMIGSVENRGQGGCNFYHWTDKEAGDKLEKYAKEKYTEFNFEQLDSLLSDIIANMESEKQYRRWCKKGSYYRLKGDKEGSWREVTRGGGNHYPYCPEVKAWILKNAGDKLEEILNERFPNA